MPHPPIARFNLRVYGLLVQENRVLVTHENRNGMVMTKFPGGGLEFGEGLADCLVREFKEELNIEIEVGELFYTNEFLQISAFDKTDQLHSFYYWITTDQKIPAKMISSGFRPTAGEQVFEWIDVNSIEPVDLFTFPIDKIVGERIQDKYVNEFGGTNP